MAAWVIGQQAVHDLRGSGDQCAVIGQGSRQRLGGNETVVAVIGIDTRLDTAPPGIPDDLAHPGRALDLARQTRSPALLQCSDGAVIQRSRPQGREVIEVLPAKRQGHRGIHVHVFDMSV